MGDCLATIDIGRKLGVVPLSGEEAGPHLTQCIKAEAYLPTKWHLHPSSRLITIDMGRGLYTDAGKAAPVNFEVGGCCAPFRGGVWVPI